MIDVKDDDWQCPRCKRGYDQNHALCVAAAEVELEEALNRVADLDERCCKHKPCDSCIQDAFDNDF